MSKVPVIIDAGVMVAESQIIDVRNLHNTRLVQVKWKRTPIATNLSLPHIYENWQTAPRIEDINIPVQLDAEWVVRVGDILMIEEGSDSTSLITHKHPVSGNINVLEVACPFYYFFVKFGYVGESA